MNKIGLISGRGQLPILLSKEIKNKGYSIAAIAIIDEAQKELESIVDSVHWEHLGKLQSFVDFFKEEGVNEVIMVGKVNKSSIFSSNQFDGRFQSVLNTYENNQDDNILSRVADEFLKDNIKLIDPSEFLGNFLPEKGILTSIQVDSDHMKDIEYGFDIAKNISDLDIGQTVVVKNQVVLAVEALEGTDNTIKRGSQLGKGNVTVAKVSRPLQDMRFDIPVVGMTTLELLIENKVSSLVIDSKTIILNMDEFIKKAQQNNISVVVK